MRKLMELLWPSFLVAGVAEMAFFTLLDPKELFLFGQPVHFSPLATYSIGFFGFWLACGASSLLTWFLGRSADEVNQRT